MLTLIKLILAGTCLLGTAGNTAQPQAGYLPPRSIEVLQKVSTEEYIGEDEAAKIALEDAGVKEKETDFMLVHLDREDGVMVYEVEFTVGDKEYDYDIDAATGKILEKDSEIEDHSSAEGTITKEEAKKIALQDAGFDSNEVEFKKVEHDFDNGIEKIEVEFVVGETVYEYDIDAKTGKILDADTDSVYDD